MLSRVFSLKSISTLLLAALVFFGTLGISHAGMSVDMEGNMNDCPFMPGGSICTMNPVELLAASQSFLNNVVSNQDYLLILSAIALTLTVLPHFLSPPKLRVQLRVPKRKLLTSFNFLKEAFSDGILNPKLF